MNDAPERIWANTTNWGDGKPLCGEWNHCDVGRADDYEYIRADLSSPLGAVAMRDAAAKMVDDFFLYHPLSDTVRALPPPTHADLLAAAPALPEVARLVDAANRFELLSRDSSSCIQDEADQIIEAAFAELRAALAALTPKGADHE